MAATEVLIAVFCSIILIPAIIWLVLSYMSKTQADSTPPAGLQGDEQYQTLDVRRPEEAAQPAPRQARYESGMRLHRNMQDPSVAFKFGGNIGTLEGEASVGETIVIDSVYTDEKGDLKYRVQGAKASCKTTVLEKHFDRRDGTNVRQLGDVVTRNNVDKKMEFNMKGKLGIVRPGTVATVASVFVDRDGEVKYTLKGAINWLPESKFIKYFSRVEGESPPGSRRNTAHNRSMIESEADGDELKETLLAS
eukprot:TRINITY_DN3134_c0_g1_i1.p1 TRINITY_DN3134_c0_g1~~TRINITY_DN3134_c0_g1_i1.p1  ORF type:complete len:250 (+),score=102.48 TRINITY_DN3134_c0_g1_i1:127-876(+)